MIQYDHAAVIQGCKRQDRKSQKTLFDAYADGMMAVCCRYLKSLPDAEEAMLAGFTRFFASVDRFVYSGQGSIQPWLRKIMVNECLMALRSGGKLAFVREEFGFEESDERCSGLDNLQAAEIRAHIAALPDGYRTVFNLFVVEGYAHKEIADLLSITEGTSRSQLSKARMLLQTKINKYESCYGTATE